jgi:hypothetical protein
MPLKLPPFLLSNCLLTTVVSNKEKNMRQQHLDAMLMNWGRWMCKREVGALGYGQCPLMNLMGRVSRADAGALVPVDDIEASKVDDAVRAQTMELQRLARAWYVDGLTVRGTATRLGCSTTTVPKRLDALRLNVQVWWAQQAREKNHFGV